MKRIAIISAIFAMAMLPLRAQSVSESRAIRTTALQVYDRYVNLMGRLHDGNLSNETNFLDLFADGTDSLYNDILPNDKPRYLTPDDYYALYTQSVKSAAFSYSNFIIRRPHDEGSQWSVTFSFTREVNYSTEELSLPSWSFQYLIRIVMDKNYNSDHIYANARISSITVANPFANLVVISNPQRVPLRWQGKVVSDYDASCDCWMQDLGKGSVRDLSYDNNNPLAPLTLSAKGNIHSFRREQHNILGFGLAFAPFGFGNGLDGQYADIEGSNNAFRLGAFYGLNLLAGDRTSGFLNIGLELANKNFSFEGLFEEHFDAVDADGDPYVRNINGTLIDESWHTFGLSVPVTFSYLFNLTPGSRNALLLSAEGGLYASLRFAQSCSYQVKVDYTGTYPQYFGVEMDHYYDYGKDVHFTESDVEPDKGGRSFDLGLTFGVALWYQLNEQSFLRFDISARKGFMSETDYLADYHLTANSNSYIPVLRSVEGGLFDTYVGLSFILLK